MSTHIPEHTLHTAARWHARLAAADFTAAERDELERWLADPVHARAYAQVERSASRVAQLMRNDPRLLAMADAALAESSVKRGPSRQRVAIGLAASVLAGLIALRFLPEWTTPEVPSLVYSTGDYERRSVELADGSTVHLDVGSTIHVQMSDRERNVTLTTGRAYFKVAKDASRPFAVTAKDVRTTALGTEFEVQQSSAHTRVTLTEGAVEVSDAAATSWSEILAQGEAVEVTARGERARHSVDPRHVADWSRGRHELNNARLDDAIAEINRYSRVKVRIGDPSLAQLQVGGNFVAGDSTRIVAALTAALQLRAVNAGAHEIILFRRYETAPN